MTRPSALTAAEREKVGTYREEFPPGTRVIVRASASEGTDHLWNGRTGTIVDHGHFIAVDFDKPPRGMPNPYLICPHNLRAAGRAALEGPAQDTAVTAERGTER